MDIGSHKLKGILVRVVCYTNPMVFQKLSSEELRKRTGPSLTGLMQKFHLFFQF
jgi:hypothetical protein